MIVPGWIIPICLVPKSVFFLLPVRNLFQLNERFIPIDLNELFSGFLKFNFKS